MRNPRGDRVKRYSEKRGANLRSCVYLFFFFSGPTVGTSCSIHNFRFKDSIALSARSKRSVTCSREEAAMIFAIRLSSATWKTSQGM